MLYMLFATIVLASLGIALLKISEDHYRSSGGFAFTFGAIFVLVSGLGLAIMIAISFDWVAASHKASIINAEYGTSYTREDVFYASSVIDTIREIDRKRVEVNGNLITGESKE